MSRIVLLLFTLACTAILHSQNGLAQSPALKNAIIPVAACDSEQLTPQMNVCSSTLSRSGKYLIAGLIPLEKANFEIRIFDQKSLKLVQLLQGNQTEKGTWSRATFKGIAIDFVGITTNDKWLCAAAARASGGVKPLMIFQNRKGKFTLKHALDIKGQIIDMVCSADSVLILTADSVQEIDPKSGKQKWEFANSKNIKKIFALPKSGHWAGVAVSELFLFESGKQSGSARLIPKGYIISHSALSADGSLLAVSGRVGGVIDLKTLKVRRLARMASGPIQFSPNNKKLYVFTGIPALMVYDVEAGDFEYSIEALGIQYHENCSIHIRPDGNSAVVGGGGLTTWELPDQPVESQYQGYGDRQVGTWYHRLSRIWYDSENKLWAAGRGKAFQIDDPKEIFDTKGNAVGELHSTGKFVTLEKEKLHVYDLQQRAHVASAELSLPSHLSGCDLRFSADGKQLGIYQDDQFHRLDLASEKMETIKIEERLGGRRIHPALDRIACCPRPPLGTAQKYLMLDLDSMESTEIPIQLKVGDVSYSIGRSIDFDPWSRLWLQRIGRVYHQSEDWNRFIDTNVRFDQRKFSRDGRTVIFMKEANELVESTWDEAPTNHFVLHDLKTGNSKIVFAVFGEVLDFAISNDNSELVISWRKGVRPQKKAHLVKVKL